MAMRFQPLITVIASVSCTCSSLLNWAASASYTGVVSVNVV